MSFSRASKAKRTVDGIVYFKVTCPVCSGQNTTVRSTHSRRHPVKRYHHCPDCDSNFHSVQASAAKTLKAATSPSLWPLWHTTRSDDSP